MFTRIPQNIILHENTIVETSNDSDYIFYILLIATVGFVYLYYDQIKNKILIFKEQQEPWLNNLLVNMHLENGVLVPSRFSLLF